MQKIKESKVDSINDQSQQKKNKEETPEDANNLMTESITPELDSNPKEEIQMEEVKKEKKSEDFF